MKRTRPTSDLIYTCEKLKKRTTAKLNLVYFGEDLEGGDSFDAFIAASKHSALVDDFSFYHSSDIKCGKKMGATIPGVTLIRNFDESPLYYSPAENEAIKVDDLVEFAKFYSVPTVINFSDEYVKLVFGQNNPALILFADEDTNAHHNVVFAEAAKTFKGQILFVKAGMISGYH